MTPRILLFGMLCLCCGLLSCSGFRVTPSDSTVDREGIKGSVQDAGLFDGLKDAPLPADDQRMIDYQSDKLLLLQDASFDSHLDANSKLSAGHCCAKPGDCQSGHCVSLGNGPYICSQSCTKSPDNCPIGFLCSSEGICAPPNEKYHCGPQVAKAQKQGLGGCCAKDTDCVSGPCHVNGEGGAYYCSQPCTLAPDNCPAGYLCASHLVCYFPGVSTCAWQ